MNKGKNSFIEQLRQELPDIPTDGLKKEGAEFHGPCPFCGGVDRFTVFQGAERFLCRKCAFDKGGDKIDYWKRHHKCANPRELEQKMGIISSDRPVKEKRSGGSPYPWEHSAKDHPAMRAYFKGRGITFSELFPLPPALRFNTFKNKNTGKPAARILAAVSQPGDTALKAHHSTWLEGAKSTKKTMKGPCKGKGVWFYPDRSKTEKKLVIGEGIETTLSAMQATGINGVAGLDAGKMQAIVLPGSISEVYILADEDESFTGQKAALKLAKRLEDENRVAWIISPSENTFSDRPRKIDFNDLTPEQICERFEKLIAPSSLDKTMIQRENKKSEIALLDEDGNRKTKATVLIEIGSQYELFHDENGDGYATIAKGSHKETWPIRSKAFAELLSDQYFMLSKKGVSRNIVADASDTLCGMARNQGERFKVYRRIAEKNGNIYLDLCDSDWRVVEVSAADWQVITDPPVKFIRSASSKPLPAPVKGGILEDLWSLINVRPADRPLIAGFLSRALHPTAPYFGLCVVGEQGTGKSTFTTMLRSLCDPSTAMLRPPPKDERDFLAGAVNNWCLTYDNLSGMKPWLSDALCRVLTGGSFAARTLYSTVEETTIPLSRPVILNGIDDLTARPDLADRVIAIELQPIQDSNRMEERELWKKFDRIKGEILGVLLDGISSALQNIDDVKLTYRPRQIDAARWATAAETGLDIAPGTFIQSYRKNQQEMVSIALESSPFIAAILDMLKDRKIWEGSPSTLLSLLPDFARDEEAVKSKAWPKSPSWVSKIIKRNAPALRKIGIEVEQSRTAAGRYIHLSMMNMTTEPKNLTPHSQDFGNEQACNEQGRRREVNENYRHCRHTVTANDDNDDNDGKNQKVSHEGTGCPGTFTGEF